MSEQLSLIQDEPTAEPRLSARVRALRTWRAKEAKLYRRALILGDTRAQHSAWLKLRDATNAALRGRA